MASSIAYFDLSSALPLEKCTFSPDPGNCRAFIPSFFFNSTSQLCEQFIYGGCQGNPNRFKTIEECLNDCGNLPSGRLLPTNLTNIEVAPPSTRSNFSRNDFIHCFLPPATGTCKALIPRFFYNETSKQCSEFIYGGCDGNENRFTTLLECNINCKQPLDSIVGNSGEGRIISPSAGGGQSNQTNGTTTTASSTADKNQNFIDYFIGWMMKSFQVFSNLFN